MGEQPLSPKYFDLGTQLPIDRFLTFYSAHTGLQVNNIMAIPTVQMFIVPRASVDLCAVMQLRMCKHTSDGHFLGGHEGSYNLFPVSDCIRHGILGIFLLSFTALLPLFPQ
ncbi:glycosyl transferase, partial [Auricularia subglabra TFB-10046 SS5]